MSLRQIMSVVMLFVCFFNYKTLRKGFNKYIVGYLIFLIFWILSAIFEGTLGECLRNLAAQHCVSLVAYFSTVLIYSKYRNTDILINTLFICGIANSVINILQSFGEPVSMIIGSFFVDEDASAHFKRLEEGVHDAYSLGLLGGAVPNGAFSMILPFIPMYYLYRGKNFNVLKRLFYWGIFCVFIVALFFIQQRSCMAIALLCLMIVFYKVGLFKGRNLAIILVLIVPIAIFALKGFVESDTFLESRYMYDDHEESRTSIYVKAVEFIIDNFFIGGLQTFRAITGYSPHNIVLNAFIYAGFLGGIIILYVYFSQLYKAYRLRLNKGEIVLGWMFIAEMLNAFLHNASILTGDFLTWTLWAMIFMSYYNRSMLCLTRSSCVKLDSVSARG